VSLSKLILVLGGVKSGKSAFAEKLIYNCKAVSYIATAKPVDEEMKQKIEAHQKRRPSSWQTIELDSQTINECFEKSTGRAVIVDCLGNLVTRVMEGGGIDGFVNNFPETVKNFKNKFEIIIIVSNEVGLSLVSPYESGRQFCNHIGLLNQKIADLADETYLLVAGQPIKIK
jgi:adenosylcobinamide kinase/adenosylcobinamide-phosphate guanylyltransferase